MLNMRFKKRKKKYPPLDRENRFFSIFMRISFKKWVLNSQNLELCENELKSLHSFFILFLTIKCRAGLSGFARNDCRAEIKRVWFWSKSPFLTSFLVFCEICSSIRKMVRSNLVRHKKMHRNSMLNCTNSKKIFFRKIWLGRFFRKKFFSNWYNSTYHFYVFFYGEQGLIGSFFEWSYRFSRKPKKMSKMAILTKIKLALSQLYNRFSQIRPLETCI